MVLLAGTSFRADCYKFKMAPPMLTPSRGHPIHCQVIAEWIFHRLRRHRLCSEMDDRVDRFVRQYLCDQALVAELADNQFGFSRHGPTKPGREIVEDDNLLAVIEQFVDHMAADISGAACDQNAHVDLTSNCLLAIGNSLASRIRC